MATNTNNYGFKKPEENDFYSIEDQNRNWDLADTKMAQLNSDLLVRVNNSSILAKGIDFNKVTVSGFYRFNSKDDYLNAPPHSWGQLLVIHGGGDTIAQISFDYDSAACFYMRTGNPPECGGKGTWRGWHKYTGIAV